MDQTSKIALLTITSNAFKEQDYIPVRYTCDGININPPLHIDGIPEDAKCLALIVDDPDAPAGTWVHWVMWNIPVLADIKEDDTPGTEGVNDFRLHHYGGPCPPSGTHRYFFKVYALDKTLELASNAKKGDLERAMAGHILAKGELIGLYKRTR